MKYFLIILLLANFALYSKEKKSIYVYKVLTKNTKDPNFESKFRNKMTAILLRDFSEYNLMDDDSIAGLKAKLEKSKMFGCNEEACMREISRSLNADEVITGTIEENNGRFKYSFKNSSRVKKGEENLSIKSLADGEFYLNQWEYFTGEIVRKLMNPSYTMNYKDAPPFENLDEFNYVTVKDLKEIKLPEIKGNTLDIVKRLKEVTIADADAAYQKKDYLLALNGFRDARDALASLSPEDKIKAGNMATDIQNRIYMAGDAMFAERLEELDSYYKENSPMSLKALKRSKGLDGWKLLSLDYQKAIEEGERNPVTEKRIVKNIRELSERKYRLLMEEEEKSGDEKLAKGKYDSAISYYEDALDVVRLSEGYLGEIERSSLGKKLADARAKRWDTDMEELYAKIEKKSEDLWKEGEYADYYEYLQDKGIILKELKAKGGTRGDLVANVQKKLNQYGSRLREEEKTISNRISLYKDASLADESYFQRIEQEREKETARSAQLRNLTYPRRFDPPFFHFPGSPQGERSTYKYGFPGFKSHAFAYASYASFLFVSFGALQYQGNNQAYKGTGTIPPFVYYSLSYNGNQNLGYTLLAIDRYRNNVAFEKVEASAGVINSGLGFYGFLVILSNLDFWLTTSRENSFTRNEGIPLIPLEKGGIGFYANLAPIIPRQSFQKAEMQYNLEYKYHFE